MFEEDSTGLPDNLSRTNFDSAFGVNISSKSDCRARRDTNLLEVANFVGHVVIWLNISIALLQHGHAAVVPLNRLFQ
jgi:hypothetical protein